MKRFVSILAALLLISGLTLADMPDFASMSFDELSAMKTALDQEYLSRQESEGITLGKGSFVVGRDLKAGTYYAAMVTPSDYSSNTYVEVRNTNGVKKLQSYFTFGEEPAFISLEEGYTIELSGGSLFLKASPYTFADYYMYDPPKGTVAPVGQYYVGDDIPAGTYNLYPVKPSGGEYKIYKTVTNDDGTTSYVSKDGYRSSTYVTLCRGSEYNVEKLDEGDVVDVRVPILFVKPQKLNFE